MKWQAGALQDEKGREGSPVGPWDLGRGAEEEVAEGEGVTWRWGRPSRRRCLSVTFRLHGRRQGEIRRR